MCKKNDYSTSNIEKEQIILKCFITKEDIKNYAIVVIMTAQ